MTIGSFDTAVSNRVITSTTFTIVLRFIQGIAISTFLALLVTASAVVTEPLPDLLKSRHYAVGMVVEDAQGKVLGQIRDAEFHLASPVQLSAVPGQLQRAVLAAEDARFYSHCGVDPLAVGRAVWQLLRSRHIVSGASTITQQLARSVVPRSRTFYGKWREMVVSLRIELALGKGEILEAYLNHVSFGLTTRGIAAAAEEYFGKPLLSLSLAESAALAALPRGPTRYHPGRSSTRLLARRDQILRRMLALNWESPEAVALAQRERVAPRSPARGPTAPHLLRALAQGRLGGGGPAVGNAARLRTTVNGDLQRRIEKLIGDARGQLAEAGASAVAVVVIDNPSASLLAYVGSADFFDQRSLGQNDGCLALRQPGSTLKPFLYSAALEWLAMGPTTQLKDIETEFDIPTGVFSPKNYDDRYRGLVLLRDALGSSLNVPAVRVAERVGIARFLEMLHRFGFESLSKPASHYGLALALGDGEVRPIELALAYSTLGRSGLYRPLRVVTDWTDEGGQAHSIPLAAATRAVSEETAWQLLEMLSDDAARGIGFGRHGLLEMPMPAATKTGTSSNHRDNWAAAVTHEVTAVVWVGNFDGRPLARGTSGVVGAAPLLRSVLQSAMHGRRSSPLFPTERFVSRRVCSTSGDRPGPSCRDVVEVRLVHERPTEAICSVHRRLRIDPSNDLLAGPGCRNAIEREFESYPDDLAAWAKAAGRPVAPKSASPRCPPAEAEFPHRHLRLRAPALGGKYLVDPHIPLAQQRLAFSVDASMDVEWVEYDVDGQRSGPVRPPFHWDWPIHPGAHRLIVRASQGSRVEAQFDVE